MKWIVQLTCLVLFSPVIAVMALVVTVVWAFDPKDRPWGSQWDAVFLGRDDDQEFANEISK